MENLISHFKFFCTQKDEHAEEILTKLTERILPDFVKIEKIFFVSLRFGDSESDVPGLIEALKIAKENLTSPVILFGVWCDWEIKKGNGVFFDEFIHRPNTGYLVKPFSKESLSEVLKEIYFKMFD